MWLCPMCSLEIEYYEIGKVCTVFVLTTKNEQFIALVKSRCMT
jgi:hypothetical protein